MEQIHQQHMPLQGPPKNWLVESILVTIFCCLPFGIAGIVYASQVNSKYADGDLQGALRASNEAGKWTKIGFWIGVVCIVAYLAFVFIFGGIAIWGLNRSGNFND